MNQNTPHYHAYLLRFWRDDENSTWHASLEDPHTGQSHHFANTQRLYDFLNQTLTTSANKTAPPNTD